MNIKAVRNLMFDLAIGKEIFDEEQNRVISKVEANEAIRKVCYEVLGITEKSSVRDMNRALRRDAAHELFQVIEEALDVYIATGWHESEFFQNYVEERNMADGDKNEFWTDDNVILEVSKVSGDHHDLNFRRVRIAQAV